MTNVNLRVSAHASASPACLPGVTGTGRLVKLASGAETRVVQLNNAATTPPFRATLEAVSEFLGTYGALHRGSGPHARATCEAVEAATQDIRRFLGLTDDHALLFTTNTSSAINLLARLLDLGSDQVVLTSEIEHTSNNLPWRFNSAADVVEIHADDTGLLDMVHLEQLTSSLAGKVAVIAVTGASNQTGVTAPLPRITELAGHAGALFFVDAAQLAPHRPIDLGASGVDALALSAHKLYAPFGLGLLALPRWVLDRIPVDPGGGSIDMLGEGTVVWSPPSTRHQTGTWNAAGIVGLGASCRTILDIGWDVLLDHEAILVQYAADRLGGIPGVRLHVPPVRYVVDDRIGTFPFSVEGYHHALVASILEHEFGIEVRSGTICNHRLVRRWFGIDDDEQRRIEALIEKGNRLASYGIVRASLGIQNVTDDIDALADALEAITVDGPRLRYREVPNDETFEPEGP
jgi:cysteine desulfurase/selenocysteine lyase